MFFSLHCVYLVFSGGSDNKESACNTRDLGSIPGLEKFPGEGYFLEWECPSQYYCLGNHMDRGNCQAAVHGLAESDTAEQLTISSISVMIIIVS